MTFYFKKKKTSLVCNAALVHTRGNDAYNTYEFPKKDL